MAVTSASTDQDKAQRKTPQSSATAANNSPTVTNPTQTPGVVFGEGSTSTRYAPALEKNILNNYRSWTYNFTIGALPPEAVTGEIDTLETNIEKFRVLDSSGKGTRGVGLSQSIELSTSTQGLNIDKIVEGFNQNSPGRFDLFIDDVSIDSLIGAGSTQSGSSIASNIEFTVYEPYSMNGFIEALQVAANAAAYPNYMQAVFAMRVRFIGYRDDVGLSGTPEIIPNSTRYFCINIAEIEVDVTQDGTRYKCSAVPYNQMGFGTPNILLSDIKISGNTVHEVLKNLFKAINTMVADEAKTARGEQNPKRDYYEISCPALVQKKGSQSTIDALLYSDYPGRISGGPNDKQSDIIKSPMNDELKEVNVFQMADPAATTNGYAGSKAEGSTQPAPASTPPATSASPTTPNPSATPTASQQPLAQPASSGSGTSDQASQDPATQRLIPSQGTVVFGAGRQIHDCIAAVVRDSKYVRGDLLTKQIKEAKENKTLFVNYFTVRLEVDLIPEFDTFSNRYFCVYRYVLEPYRIPYTRIPTFEQGEVDHTPILNNIKREYNYIYSGKNVDVLKFQLKFDSLYYAAVPSMFGNRPDRPNAVQAVGHNNTVDVKAKPSTIAVEQTSNPDPQKVPTAQIARDPSANITNNVATAGQPQADPYYRLAQTIHSTVLNGVDLIQGTLEILGDPYFLVTGGMGNQNLRLSEDSLYQTTDGQAAVTQGDLMINLNFKTPKDISVGGPNSGFIEFDAKLLPFSGVYRVVTLKSNFKDGVFTQAIDIIRAPGQIELEKDEKPAEYFDTSPLSGSQIVADSKSPSILSEGIRDSALDFANIIKRGLPDPGLPGVSSNFTKSLLSVQDAFNDVQQVSSDAGNILNQVSGVSGQLDSIVSQVGVDPLGGINPLTKGIKLSPSAFGEVSSGLKLAAASISSAGSAIGDVANISNANIGLASNVADAISSIPGVSALPKDVANLTNKSVSGLVGDIGNSIAKIQNAVKTDLSGVSAKLGIDPAKLSGLSSNLSSKLVSQIEQIADLIPKNTSIKGLEEIGLYYKHVSGTKLSNLPALNPEIPAPDPIVDPAYLSIVLENGEISKTLNGKTALAALTEINKVRNSLGQLASAIDSGLGSVDTLSGQINQINQQVNSVVGDAKSVPNQVGSLAQNSISTMKNSASLGLGSVESNISSVNAIVQSVGNTSGSIEKSVNVRFGSLQTESPLSKLISNSNIKGSSI